MASAVSCRQFIHMILNQTELTFPQLNIQDNITIAQTDLVKIALSNMSATLSQYVTVLKNQTEKEYDQLCAPAKRIQTECHYPAACSKLTPTSDAIFYCYLKQTLSYLVDTILFLDSPCHNTPMASAVSCPHFIHMLLNQTELTFPQLYIQDNITIAQTDLVKIALSNMSAILSQYVTVLKNQTETEYDQLCAPAKRIQTKCYYPAACSKLTPTSDAIFYCYLKQTLSYLVDTILFLDSPIALSNMSASLSQYVTVLKNQTEKEYDQLYAPAKRIQTECYYPAACSKLTPTSDAIFYCYLKQTLSYLVDTIFYLDSPIFSNIKQNVEVDDSLLLPDDVPITKQRWFTIITLHTLHENINHIQNTLESFM
ncbi:Hypothetical predicted protein [Octopus vulgaris]|uniref:Uncharacterized protein n=1 Tax=Octopus vulgaris TaxID=6645 RepID=A0AA36F4T5_OCTVU|nr:Hypothetical predicted protein [Octopus vulgaris]